MIILVGTEKGGVGKSTIALNLATQFAKDYGTDNVIIVDSDPQGSISKWGSIRNYNEVHPEITIVSSKGSTVHKDILSLSHKYEIVIVDVAGKDTPELRSASLVSDLILVPLSISQFDIFSTQLMQVLIEEARIINEKLKALLVISKRPTNPSLNFEYEDTINVSKSKVWKIADTSIYERVSYRRSIALGMGVVELPSQYADKKAKLEIENLYKEILNEIEN